MVDEMNPQILSEWLAEMSLPHLQAVEHARHTGGERRGLSRTAKLSGECHKQNEDFRTATRTAMIGLNTTNVVRWLQLLPIHIRLVG